MSQGHTIIYLLIMFCSAASGANTKQEFRGEKHRAYAFEALKQGSKSEACEEFRLAAHYLPEDQAIKKQIANCRTTIKTSKPSPSSESKRLTEKDRHLLAWIFRTIAEAFERF